MNEILSKLTGDQALQVLERLAAGDAGLARTIKAAAKHLLTAVGVDEIVDEIPIQPCAMPWTPSSGGDARTGRST
jgi:hypothetical protein